MTLRRLVDEVDRGLARTLKSMGLPRVEYSVEQSRPGFGDVSSNVSFLLAGRVGRNPRQISREIAASYGILPDALVHRVAAHPSGHLNFFADLPRFYGLTIRESSAPGYGSSDLGGGRRLSLEHTSVNPNKPLHIGHIRNVVVGDAVARMLRYVGHDVRVLNYVDDSGLQVADILLGFIHLGFAEEPPDGEKFDHYCGGTVYVETTRRYEEDSTLQERRTEIMRGIEDPGSEIAGMALRVTGRVLRCQLETCWRLGVRYDCLNFESQIIHSGLWRSIFERLRGDGLIRLEADGRNAGCWVIRARDGDLVLVRSNGTATYTAKDIPYAAWKLGLVEDPFTYVPYAAGQPDRALWQTALDGSGASRDMAADRTITVIDSRQSGPQDIVRDLMERFSGRSGSYLHLAYESVTLGAETARRLGADASGSVQMSGRRGLYVDADSIIALLEGRARSETARRNPGWAPAELDGAARDVAVGTIRYEMIKQDLDKPITFDHSKSLSLEGDTAPYIQYAHARACRILERAGIGPDPSAAFDALGGRYEGDLLRLIAAFPLRVSESAKNLAPKGIARYCHSLAVSFNAFYEHVRVIDPGDAVVTNQRLCLVASFESTVRQGLGVLGIPAPDRM